MRRFTRLPDLPSFTKLAYFRAICYDAATVMGKRYARTTQPRQGEVRQLRLNTRQNARRSLCRLIREFDADPDANVSRFIAKTRAIRQLLDWDRFDVEVEWQERVARVEERLEAIERGEGG